MMVQQPAGTTATPGLSRAIADCTQPYSQMQGDLLRSLQKHLLDAKSTDGVYKALVMRAWAEPVSEAVVERVIAIFKQLLLRHPPGGEVLQILNGFCVRVGELLALSKPSVSSLQYVQSCVRKLQCNDKNTLLQASAPTLLPKLQHTNSLARKDGARPPPLGHATSFKHNPLLQGHHMPTVPHHQRMASAPPATLTSTLLMQGSGPHTPGVSGSHLPHVTSGLGLGLSGNLGAASSHDVSQAVAGTGLLPELQQVLEAALAAGSGQVPEPLLLLPAEEEGPHPMDPVWALPTPLLGGAASAGHPSTSSTRGLGPTDMRWVAQVPELRPSLAVAPDVTDAEDRATAGSWGGGAPVTVPAITACVLDLDPAEVPEHLAEVAAALKLEQAKADEAEAALQAATPQGKGRKGPGGVPGTGAKRGGGGGHARALFHHQPYALQEGLSMSEADVAVVVEVVCGAAAARAFVGGEHEGGDAGGAAAWEDAYEQGSLGQVCGAILVKLVMDLWLTAGPGNSYPLILRMLRKTLTSRKPQVRARAFDLLYNLALHSALLAPAPLPPSLAASNAAGGGVGGLSSSTPGIATPVTGGGLQHGLPSAQQIAAAAAVAPVGMRSPLGMGPAIGGGGSTRASADNLQRLGGVGAGSAGSLNTPRDVSGAGTAGLGATAAVPVVSHVQLMRWLRALTFQLVSDMTKMSEGSDVVWRAALGCFLHLTTHAGHWVDTWVSAAPLSAVAGLLRACREHAWSQDVHVHLLRLASVLLLRAPPDVEAASPVSTDVAGGSGRESMGQLVQPRPGGVPAEFGGLPAVLDHLAHAPTAASQADMLAVLVHYLTPDAGVEAELGRILTARGAHTFAMALHCALRAPRAGTALRLAAAMSAIGVGGAGGTVAANPAAATLRALGATLPLHSTHGGAGGGASGVLPPAAAELLLGFLTLVEECALAPVSALLSSPHLVRAITMTVSHITPVATAATSGMDPAAVSHAWAELRAACLAAGTPSTQGGPAGAGPDTLALHWLHQVLLQAFHVCQGSPLLLSPLSLRTSEAGRLVGGGTAGSSGPWTAALADTLLAVVREAPGGCRLLLAAVVRVVSDLKQGIADAASRHKLVMSVYYMAMLWVMQSEGRAGAAADRQAALTQLCDLVLAAVAMPMAEHGAHVGTGMGPSQPLLAPMGSGPPSLTRIPSGRAVGAGGDGEEGAEPQGADAAINMHVATALLAGLAGFAPEPLQATPPELLVSLVQNGARAHSSPQSLSMGRGFAGRPLHAAGVGALLTGSSTVATSHHYEGANALPGGLVGLRTAFTGTAGMGGEGGAEGAGGWEEAEMSPPLWCDVAMDRSLALLLTLMARCALDPDAFAKYSLSHVIRSVLLSSEDPRERYYAGVYLLKHWQLNQQDRYWRTLKQLVLQAQQYGDERLLNNPYLTVNALLAVESRG